MALSLQESAPPSSRAELRVEASPTPSVISVRGGPSRSSSRGTVRDGILVRYEGDNNNSMLRRPRTSSTDAGKLRAFFPSDDECLVFDLGADIKPD